MQSWLRSVGVNCSVISEVSNNGGKYGRRRATLKTGCKPRKGGMLSTKALSPTTLVMVYGPYRSGRSFWWVPIRHSFYKYNQTLSPTWNLCGTQCWSWRCLYLALDFCKISWTCWWMCWIRSMNRVDLLTLVCAWDTYACVDERGSATSMGPNGWNPNPT